MRAARRCTAPINAPWPPPTIPSRRRRRRDIALSVQAERVPIGRLVRGAAGVVLKVPLGDLDDVCANQVSRLPCPLLGVFQAALPLDHGPGTVAVLRQLAEHAREVHLAVADGAEPPSPVHPVLETAIDTLLAGRIQFS